MSDELKIPNLADLSQIRQFVETAPNGGVMVEDAWGSSIALMAKHLRDKLNRPMLLIVPDPEAGDELQDDFESWGADNVHHFPPWDILPSEADHIEFETLRERIRVMRAAAAPVFVSPLIVITPITALMQPTIPKENLETGELVIEKGKELAPESLCGLLLEAGFEQVMSVDEPGRFCRRGGIIDIFPVFSEVPFRVEFFGDEIDSIHVFDPINQRSGLEVDSCILVDISADSVRRAYREENPVSIASHLPEDTLVICITPERCMHMAELYEDGMEHAKMKFFSYRDACESVNQFPVTIFSDVRGSKWPEEWGEKEAVLRIEAGTESMSRLEGSTVRALGELDKLLDGGNKVTLFCHNAPTRDRCQEILEEEVKSHNKIDLQIGRLTTGFAWPALKWAVTSSHEVFNRYRHRPRKRRKAARGSPLKDFTELKSGDYVVHVLHGIARFSGIKRLRQNGHEGDYLTLVFAGDTNLYVPISHVELVQKYIGGRDSSPELSKLGGRSWKQKKERAERSMREVAADLLRIQAVRKHSPGIRQPADNDWQRKFEGEFIYEETDDQMDAITAIKEDMQNGVPMDRLLCGDVGFGKTEVAIRAAFKAVMGGNQVAVLVPTTILCEQHYRTFSERTADFPVTVEVLSRFRTASQQREVIEKARAGQVDILIGTHRILSKDVSFKNLGLIVIDEEQRFGVEHKERLKELRTCVDVLTMTATPIPRTLHMGMIGLRDISTLATPPFDRQAIRTQVVRYSDDLIRRAILRELSRNGQVFFVHNRVFNIDHVAANLSKLIPEARFGIGHGQMKEHELEDVMLDFVNQKIDVLVATTIIESGLDIPNANTIIINDADHFGLSELHQLRGRVGRYRNRAYAYFLVPNRRALTEVGMKRLKAIEEFADLGAGFNLALRDLEIRGAGNIIGIEQSGHIYNIGYELYCRLLDKVVKELSGEEHDELEPVELEMGTRAFFPDDYINLEEERLKAYRDLSLCPDKESLDSFQQSIRERFGELPESVRQLMIDESLRQRARAVGVNYLGMLDRAIVIGFTERAFKTAPHILGKYKAKRRKLTHLEDTRFRFGLGYYEEETDGYHMKLVKIALQYLEDNVVPAKKS